jgi:nucleoside-diphosphate-sugar epimerase
VAHVLVTGGGGFIGSHLAKHLRSKGESVRIVDTKFDGNGIEPYYDEKLQLDLRDWNNCFQATKGIEKVYNLAANMGGIGYITRVGAEIMHDNTLINTNMLEASRRNKVGEYFFSSSACIYPISRQMAPDVAALREEDAYPASPDSFYGWEKIYAEKMCESYVRDHGMKVRIGRYHNVYGPGGTYNGGREKSVAGLCRKVAEVPDRGTITVWGDGEQTRSYCYIDDAVQATVTLMESDHHEPINIGSDRLVTVNNLADIIIRQSGKTITKQYDLTAPQGVRGRNADLTLARKILGWEPKVSLEEGIRQTYTWIESQLRSSKRNGIELNPTLSGVIDA